MKPTTTIQRSWPTFERTARWSSKKPLANLGEAGGVVVRTLFSAVMAMLGGCSHQANVTPSVRPVSMSVEAAEAQRSDLAAHASMSFKMLHQVVANYDGRDYLMQGYLLARKDGSFRVSASAALGPQLFEVAKVHGRWESKLYVTQLAGRVDPAHLGRAVERIYFLPATGPLKAEGGSWVAASTITGEEEINRVEERRDDGTLALRQKRYFRGGNLVAQVDFDKLELIQGTWLARSVHLTDTRGFSLELRVTGYEPGFPVSDDALKVQSP